MSNGMSAEEQKQTLNFKPAPVQTAREAWRAQAVELGVNPDEPDDCRYHSEMDWKNCVLDTFKYHQPSAEQIERISNIRKGAIEFAKVIMRNVNPESHHTYGAEDFGQVIRLIHEAMMTANKSIVNEKL